MEQLSKMIVTNKTDILEKVDEKMLLLSILGSLEAITNKVVTIDEVEKFIFSPRMVKVLTEKKCNEKVVDIIEKGCELEDIYVLLPEKLDEVINELKEETIMILKNYEEYSKMVWLEL